MLNEPRARWPIYRCKHVFRGADAFVGSERGVMSMGTERGER
jgi:hypothetical protein